ncbi:MAG: rhomboid family intramembrane serine protease [Desulfuromonas sp.]|nr:MAG: rhomboid family intramembrane serine protease [Desulfuromonas sp.]
MDWKIFFDRLGMNGTVWQWRIMRWERYWKAFWRGGSDTSLLSLSRGLIYINLILFVLMIVKALAAGHGPGSLLSPSTRLLIHSGAQYWPFVIYENEWWRCITYAYTHGGLIHLAFNMMVLYQVGPLIEGEIGPARFFILYTLAALTATAAGYLWHPMVPVVGASGSLFGLIGFAVVYYHRIGPAGHELRNFMFRWAVFAFIFGIVVGADNAAHLGGAICGALLGMFLPLGIRGRQKMKLLFNSLAGAALAATVASLAFMIGSWFI